MPAQSFRIGVASVDLSVDDSTALPSLATLTFTASGTTTTSTILNDQRVALDASATYQVIVGLVGRDATNKGYTVGYCSPSSGNLTITSGQGILVSVTNANWPANFDKAVCAVIFLKTGAGNFQIADFAYIDSSNDFKHMIVAKPLATVSSFTSTLLQSTTADDTLGDRAPLGVTYVSLSPTTGGVQVQRQVAQVTVSPDNSADFQIATTRSTNIQFNLLPNDVVDVVRGNSGTYVNYTSGVEFEEAQMSLYTASAILSGNKPIKLTMPLDRNGYQEIRLYIGNLTQNQQANNESWTKTATTPITYNFVAASQDKLITDLATEIVYKRLA